MEEARMANGSNLRLKDRITFRLACIRGGFVSRQSVISAYLQLYGCVSD